MRINRRLLYAGMFLLALGAVLVAADLRAIDTVTMQGVLRLWPLAILALGVAIVIRRSPAGLPAGLLAAGVPGLVLGGAIAIGPRFIADCGGSGEATTPIVRTGTFDGPASISIRGACGTISVSTAPGSGWQLTAANSAGRTPAVEGTPESLDIDSFEPQGLPSFDHGRDDWQLSLPADAIREVSATVNASDSRIDLAGARLDSLDLTANAAQVRLDLSGASVADLSAVANAASVAVVLSGTADLTGDLRANASSVRICTAPDLGLRVTARGFAQHIAVDGVEVPGATYISDDYGTAVHHADLRVNATFGSIEIDPIGGCK